jgi:hypothetical protein
MTTITQKRKKSIWLWVIIFLLFAAVIATAILSFLGYIDLTPIQTGILSAFIWASESIVNAAILGTGFITLGAVGYWVLVNYFIGSKVTAAIPSYQPAGQTVSNTQPVNKETVIS